MDAEINELERRCGCLESDVNLLIDLANIQREKIQVLEKQVEALLECFPDLEWEE